MKTFFKQKKIAKASIPILFLWFYQNYLTALVASANLNNDAYSSLLFLSLKLQILLKLILWLFYYTNINYEITPIMNIIIIINIIASGLSHNND